MFQSSLPQSQLNHDSADEHFNLDKVLKISRMIKRLSLLQCTEWLLNCYLPSINENNQDTHGVTLQEVIVHFLHHLKRKNTITTEQTTNDQKTIIIIYNCFTSM